MIVMHHLRVGRAIFTTWLLEELGVEYELKLYDRNAQGRAPAELKEAHPLGKSPVIEDAGVTLAESGAITTYLLETYDPEGALSPAVGDTAARMKYLQWLHYSEASAFAPLLLNMLLMREDPKPPVISAFTAAEVKLHLDYFSDALGDQDYILGDAFSGADIGCAFVANMAVKFGLAGGHPNIGAYIERCKARPAFQRAMDKTGG